MADKHSMKVCLISTLHDPRGNLQDAITQHFDNIQKLFDDYIVKATPETRSIVPNAIVKKSQAAESRLLALKIGLEETTCDLFFYIDFDRLLYWYSVFPGEFVQVINNLTNELTVIGRTKAAFETHPKLQQLTEAACNLLFGQNVDILTGVRAIPRYTAQKIVKKSNPKSLAYIDAEWLILAMSSFRYFEVNGLGYEHSLFNIEKHSLLEIETRVNNLVSIMECMRDYR